MSRIESCLAALAKANKKALVPYIAAGDPDVETTLELLHGLVESGADIIEIGIPFSDPMADGPVIQHAYERALEKGINLDHVLELVAQFRQSNQNTPIVLMGYLNTIEAIGSSEFVEKTKAAGVDGYIVVDLPPEEAEELSALCKAQDLNLIFLIAPTTSQERIELIASQASGYLYYVSLRGVTGASNLNPEEVASKIQTIKSVTDLPITVGFGIKDAETAATVAAVSDGVVVGSALVSQIEQLAQDKPKLLESVGATVAAMRAGIDA